MTTTLLIDADPIAYQAAFANQSKSIDWDGDGELSVAQADRDAAIADVDDIISKYQSDLGVSKVILCLSVATPMGWRRDVLPTYKSHRKESTRPLALEACRSHIMERWKAYIRPTLEADDILGILATHDKIVKGEKIIVSIDKDLKTIPGQVYNPKRQELERVTPFEADRLHMLQTLMGDTVDGYTGIPGVGAKKAAAILKDAVTPAEMWRAVVDAYERHGLAEKDALVQARVARICRSSDYNFRAKKVRLWEPPSTTNKENK